jgi:hypothetical protein
MADSDPTALRHRRDKGSAITVTLTTSASPTSVTGISSTGESHFAVVCEEVSTFIRGRIITVTARLPATIST